MKLKWIVLGALLALSMPAEADELQLKNGEHLRGTVTAFDGATFTIQTGYGTLQVPRADLVRATIDGAGPASTPAAGPSLTDGTPGGSAGSGPAAVPTRQAYGLVPEGTLVYWPLNGTCDDDLGKHSGTINGRGDWEADRHGQSRSALRFHGRSDEVVAIAQNSGLTPAQLTISAWVKGDNPRRWARILDKLNWAGKTGYALIHHERTHVLALQAFGDDGKEIWVASRTTVGPSWMHVAATCDGRTARIYINGTLEGEATVGAPLRHNDKALTIGGGFDGYNHFPWSGDLDDIRIYGRALSAEEIGVLFQEQDGPQGVSDLMHRDRI